MQLHERRINDVVVLDIIGQLTLMKGTDQLRDKINSVVYEGARRVAINLGEVSYIDSVGLGELISSLTTVTRHGGSLKLFNVGKRSKHLLTITKLLTVFDTLESEEEAIWSFELEENSQRNPLPSEPLAAQLAG